MTHVFTTIGETSGRVAKGQGDVTTGTMLELDDVEASLLVNLGCVLPVEARDRKRVLSHPGITWAKAAECEPLETPRPVGAFARRA